MFYLVRKPVLGSPDEFQDLDFDVDVLTIGNYDTNVVVLEDLFEAEIEIKALSNTEAQFKCNDETLIVIEGREVSSGLLKYGNTYQFGVYDIEIIKNPAGFDFAVNIVKSSRKNLQHKKKFQIQYDNRSSFSIRSISYVLFFLILLFFLFIPYFGSQNNKVSKILEQMPIPSNLSWSSGPMAMAHRIPEIGNNCQVCHVKPFEKVQDKQCIDCHHNLGEHVLEQHPAIEEFSKFLCQNCHKEHNEPMQLTRTDDALCIDCHRDIENFAHENNNNVQSVTGFNQTDHPQFRLSLIQPKLINGQYEWHNQRPVFNLNNKLKEQSNLKFSHNIHLDKEVVQDESTGESLTCNNCHQLKSDKEHFKPVTMDKDCRSCHKLTFDVFNPDIELPHGNLRAAAVMLQAHFIREFTDPELRSKRAAKKIRRIPGKHSNEGTCESNGLDCGQQEALKEAEYQFTKSGCITCHEVTEYDNGDILTRWSVKPIKINDDWYAKANFDHGSHLSVKGKNEQQVCLSCHDVKLSEISADISIPQADMCLKCHEQGEFKSVELSCTRCHQFHFIQTNLDKNNDFSINK